jgi:photosystem II stability/assembly factor-like uncharacterized protein
MDGPLRTLCTLTVVTLLAAGCGGGGQAAGPATTPTAATPVSTVSSTAAVDPSTTTAEVYAEAKPATLTLGTSTTTEPESISSTSQEAADDPDQVEDEPTTETGTTTTTTPPATTAPPATSVAKEEPTTTTIDEPADPPSEPATQPAEPEPTGPTEVVGVIRSVRLHDPAYQVAPSTGCSTFNGDRCAELSWERVTGLRTGSVTSLTISPTEPDVIYVGLDSNDMSLWRSDDAGATWTQAHWSAHVSGVAVSPTDASTVMYSVIEGQIHRSEQGGINPTEVLNRRNSAHYRLSTVVYAPSDPDVAYTSGSGRREGSQDRRGESAEFHASADGGRTWHIAGVCNGCGLFHSIVVDWSDPKKLVAGTDTGVRTSSDGGTTWSDDRLPTLGWGTTKVLSLSLRPGSSEVLLASTAEFGVFRSTDAGRSWMPSNPGLEDTQTHDVAYGTNDPDVAYVTTHDGIYRSDDGGRTWEPRSGGLEYDFVRAIAVDPRDADIAYVGTTAELHQLHPEHMQEGLHRGGGIFRTTDGGRTWTPTDAGIEEANLVMMTPHPVLPYEMWTGASAGRGGFTTTDAGESWAFSASMASHYPMVFAYSSGFPTVQYLSSLYNGSELVRSTDDGRSWQTITRALEQGVSQRSRDTGLFDPTKHWHVHTHGLAVAPSDPDVVYTGTISHPSVFEQYSLAGAHIFRSTDGGDSFVEVDSGFPTNTHTSINAIVIHPTDPDVVYVMTSSYESVLSIGIYRTTDGGNSWSPVNDGLDLRTNDLQIDPVDPDILYAATDGGVYRTTDGGDTWELRSNGLLDNLSNAQGAGRGITFDLAIDPLNPLVLYAASDRGLYRTKNGGAGWYPVGEDLSYAQTPGMSPFSHDRVVEVDASGKVIYVLAGNRHANQGAPVFLYRAVLGTPEPLEYTFAVGAKTVTILSTSHLSGLVVDLDDAEIRLVAAGPVGTEGLTTLTIPEGLLAGLSRVTVDGSPVEVEVDGRTITFAFDHDGRSDVVVR